MLFFENLKKYMTSYVFSLFAILSLINAKSVTSFFLIFLVCMISILKIFVSERNKKKLSKVDVLSYAVSILFTLLASFSIDTLNGHINTRDLFRVEDEFRVLGTIGDFWGGIGSAAIGLFTLIFVFNESRENRRNDEAKDSREERREVLELNRLMLSMFIKRVEFIESKLSNIETKEQSGFRAIQKYSGGGVEYLKGDVHSFLTQLDNLVEESISVSSILAQDVGIDLGIKSIRSYKTKLLAGLLSKEHLDVYWRIVRTKEELISKLSYLCSLIVFLTNNQNEIFDLEDEDFIKIDLFNRDLVSQSNKMNFIMRSCVKLS